MICSSDPWTLAERESIRIGYEIHRDVLAEGGREGVYADLDHELIGSGKLPFVKFDHRTGETHRRFSKALAERIKANAEHLRVYFEYIKKHDRAVGGKILTARVVGPSDRRRPPHPIRGNRLKCDCHGEFKKLKTQKKMEN